MFANRALRRLLLNKFANGEVECKIEPSIGGAYQLALIFMKSEGGNDNYLRGVISIHEHIVDAIKQRGLHVGGSGSGYSRYHGGYFVEMDIGTDLMKGKEIQRLFNKVALSKAP